MTVIVLNIVKNRTFKGANVTDSNDIERAENAWIKHVQCGIQEDFNIRFKKLGPFIEDGIIHVGSRIANWMKENWNQKAFILLPTHHSFTNLVLQSYHCKDHSGIDTTLCKIQT